ncbi:MAG: hypothetical protein OEM02_16785 [Desulfobulbaceae bacterium]|nr:hypothetical protein [Desulfobulbaceae bacterium]
MTRTLPSLSVRHGLEIWREERTDFSRFVHLSEDVFRELAGPGGLKDADKKVLEHLATCSCCLSIWADYNQLAQNGFYSDGEADDWFAGGISEAASTHDREGVSVSSTCGRFLLSIYYDQALVDEAMVVLEVTGGAMGTLEQTYVCIRDRGGKQLLHGRIVGDRLARRYDMGSGEPDLQTWSIRVGGGSEMVE